MRSMIALVVLLLLPRLCNAQKASPKGWVPPHGFVPDSATAVRIAVAVWIPIYGERLIMSEQPFVATLKNGVWSVTGSLPHVPDSTYQVGGTAVARIAQRDARILLVVHYQ